MAEKKIPKAPWANSTPEQDAAYALSTGMDIEFEAEIGNYMGPYGRRQIDTDKVDFVQTDDMYGSKGKQLLGFYIRPEYDYDEEYKEMIDDHYGEIVKGTDTKLKADNIYILDPKAASPHFYAHEWTHDEMREERGEERGTDEWTTRVWDVWRARDADEFFDAVNFYNQRYGRDRTIEEAAEYLRDTFFDWSTTDDFASREAKSAEREGYVIPKAKEKYIDLPGEKFDIYSRKYKEQDPRQYFKKRFRKRQEKWDLSKSRKYQAYKKEEEARERILREQDEEIKRIQQEIEDLRKELEGYSKQ